MVNKTQDLDVLEEAVAGIYLRSAECRVQPVPGPAILCLYERRQNVFYLHGRTAVLECRKIQA